MIRRRNFLRAALAMPAGAMFARYEAFAAPVRDQVKITRITAVQLKERGTLIRIDTDAGISGYGECHGTGPFARSVIASLEGGRLPHLGLVGKDPLAIQVHFHNMFYAYPQRGRQVRILSGIDIALWDLAGKLLNQPVSKLLGGNFRDEILLYSHTGNYLSREQWMKTAEELKADPRGFKAFKVDIHHALGVRMQEYIPSISPRDARNVHQAYSLAREALGENIDIIVHCHAELDVPSAVKVAEAVEHIKPLYFEDPLSPIYSDSWLALRRTTRLPLMTGENIELLDDAMPFLQNQAVDALQPDLINSGGITGAKIIAEVAANYRIPVCLHNVSGLLLNMASQQWSAAVHNCPMMECTRQADRLRWAVVNPITIRDGRMRVSDRPGLGVDLDQEYLEANRADGEPWWG